MMKNKVKKITYITIILSIVLVISLIILMVININKIYSEYKNKIIAAEHNYNDSFEELVDNYEEASSSIGKTVEESKESIEIENNRKEQQEENKKENQKIEIKETKVEEKIKTEVVEEKPQPDPTFIYPVEGNIFKEFNKENLVYSETLKEWTTHTGVDIEAETATVVKASAEGSIKAIKNDPRYGITVIISHVNGYETRYSNLLTAEFVKEGEDVKQGQTIGTVGNTATFEIADKPHLHFELLKNAEYLNPVLYIK